MRADDTRPSPHRYVALDALRGICALCVCLYHMHANSPVTDSGFVRGSWLFVDFFFVLSGFVIAANYRKRLATGMSLKVFMVVRFGRVYPVHLVILLAYITIEIIYALWAGSGASRPAFDAAHSVASIVTNLTLTHAFGLHSDLTWNYPSWSIAVEFWTYLLFAVAVRITSGALDRWLVVAVVVAPLALLALGRHTLDVTYDLSLIRCVYGFALGALIWQVHRRRVEISSNYGFATGVEVVTVGCVVAFVGSASATPLSFFAPIVFAAAVLIFARQAGLVSSLLMTRPLLGLGALSYSVYMVHALVLSHLDDVARLAGNKLGVSLITSPEPGLRAIALLGATPLQGTLMVPAVLGVIIVAAWCLRRLVELPGQRLARRIATSMAARKPVGHSRDGGA